MIKALRAAEVENLYVFKDGPRPNNQNDLVASKEIEELINAIDWKCNVKTLFLNNNLGCGYGPYTAISWAFGSEEELIILEDDCIPTKPFFSFCERMLEKYRHDNRVRHITGRSPYPEHPVFKNYDYIFSQYAPTIGWATWKRTWDNFDMQMRELEDFFKGGGFKKEFSNSEQAYFFNKRYPATRKDANAVFHIWDFQYGLHSRYKGALGIVPSCNLIDYIGIEGTHPTTSDSEIVQLGASNSFSVSKEPDEVKIDNGYDSDYFKRFIKGNRNLIHRIVNRIKKLL